MHIDKKEIDGTWKNREFASIMKNYKNCILFGEHSVAAGEVCCTYLR